jgi:hypothetical protein
MTDWKILRKLSESLDKLGFKIKIKIYFASQFISRPNNSILSLY